MLLGRCQQGAREPCEPPVSRTTHPPLTLRPLTHPSPTPCAAAGQGQRGHGPQAGPPPGLPLRQRRGPPGQRGAARRQGPGLGWDRAVVASGSAGRGQLAAARTPRLREHHHASHGPHPPCPARFMSPPQADVIPMETLRDYIAYARATCAPQLQPEAANVRVPLGWLLQGGSEGGESGPLALISAAQATAATAARAPCPSCRALVLAAERRALPRCPMLLLPPAGAVPGVRGDAGHGHEPQDCVRHAPPAGVAHPAVRWGGEGRQGEEEWLRGCVLWCRTAGVQSRGTQRRQATAAALLASPPTSAPIRARAACARPQRRWRACG